MSNLELKGLRLLRTLDNSLSDNKSLSSDLIIHLKIEQLIPGQYQPRRQFNDSSLDELASSIQAQGIIQPLIVRKVSDHQFEIIAGERRWRAAKKAGLSNVPAIIRTVEDNVALAFSLIENIQRENLNPIEEAAAFARFHEEFEMTHEEIAQLVGRSRTAVTNILRLLALDSRVKHLLQKGKIDMGHARCLLKLNPEQQYQVACIVLNKQLNVRETEALAERIKSAAGEVTGTGSSETKYHDQCNKWSSQLSKQFETNVSVKVNKEGKGRVVIEVNSASELDWLINLVVGKN